MLIVFPFHAGDADKALKLAVWICELGGVKNHDCLLTAASSVKDPLPMASILGETFRSVELMRPHEDAIGWPVGCNIMFQCSARHIAYKEKTPWLWMEPDAVPLVPDWLDRIEAEYKTKGKPFMGARVNIPPAPIHMSGVAVYPADVSLYAPSAFRCRDGAWDVNAAAEILPRMAETNLIQHVWTVYGKVPTFPDQESLTLLDPNAVVFHRNKDLTLIDRLRENLSGGVESGIDYSSRPRNNIECLTTPQTQNAKSAEPSSSPIHQLRSEAEADFVQTPVREDSPKKHAITPAQTIPHGKAGFGSETPSSKPQSGIDQTRKSADVIESSDTQSSQEDLKENHANPAEKQKPTHITTTTQNPLQSVGSVEDAISRTTKTDSAPPAQTFSKAELITHYVWELNQVINGNPGHIATLHRELRKVALLKPAKKRKK